jgi:capsular exopolysaccharide synthesis family protein
MDTKQYLRVLHAHLLLIVAAVVVCTGAAATYAWTREPLYAAHTQLFVSTRSDSSGLTPSDLYQGGLAAQSRVQSYARILSSPPVAEAVVRRLGLSESAEDVESAITATVPGETVLIDVTVEDGSPERARDIANAVAEEFPRFVNALESSPKPSRSVVDISVTSRAELPTSPDNPPKVLYLAVGAVLGLILGVGAAALRELLSKRIRDDEAAEAIAAAPVLGHIPHDWGGSKRPLVVIDDADSPEAEAYRRLRTNLRVVTVDSDRRSLLLTSAVAGEGKTLLVANLGIAFAQAGHRVVLVDADLRRPALGRLMGLEPAPGLSELLSANVPASQLLSGDLLEAALHPAKQLPLEVLTSGSPPPNPSELLGSDGFAALLEGLTRRADIVILDSPALLSVGDAAVIARLTAAVLMVARVPSTRAKQFDMAAEALRAVGEYPVGAVLNGLPARFGRGYSYGPKTVKAPASPVLVWGPRVVGEDAARVLSKST